MKIKFKEPLLVPNFVQTDKGTISLKDLSDEEFKEYVELWVITLTVKHRQ